LYRYVGAFRRSPSAQPSPWLRTATLHVPPALLSVHSTPSCSASPALGVRRGHSTVVRRCGGSATERLNREFFIALCPPSRSRDRRCLRQASQRSRAPSTCADRQFSQEISDATRERVAAEIVPQTVRTDFVFLRRSEIIAI